MIAIDLADLQARTGEPRAALESFRDLLTSSRGLRDAFLVNSGLTALILLLDRVKRSEAAATLYGALPKLIERGAHFDELNVAIERARVALGDPAFDAAAGLGAAMTLSEAYSFARAEIVQALAETL